MERTASILQHYEEMAVLSGEMLEVARQGRWNELVELDLKRASVLSGLRAEVANDAIPDAIAARVSALIQAMLAADAETSALATSWHGELQELIVSLGTERKLFQAYGP